MRLHWSGGPVQVDWVGFDLMVPYEMTPDTLLQNTEGTEWELAWSEEFDGEALPDTTKWTYDLGNWGWGNQEPQYYTAERTENARQENGSSFTRRTLRFRKSWIPVADPPVNPGGDRKSTEVEEGIEVGCSPWCFTHEH